MDNNQNQSSNNGNGSGLFSKENKKILIVEDDAFIRDFYQELLTTEGYQVTVAEDGGVGEEKMRQGGWDLVLLDIMLPKKDGLTILQELKNQNIPHGKVLMLTNLGNESVINQAFQLGVEGYLIKSAMDPEQILSEIHNFLKKS